MGRSGAYKPFVAVASSLLIAVPLTNACGLEGSGEATIDLDADRAGAGDGGGVDCAACAAGDDTSPSSPNDGPGNDGPGDSLPESALSLFNDSGGPAEADAADCNDLCVASTCGGPCSPGSVCQLYLSCLLSCGFSDSAFCSDDCETQYPTGPLLAACTIACGAECVSSSGGGGYDASTSRDATRE